MLSTLARIAKQLEEDGHFALADQADEIITAIANREDLKPFESYRPGAIWDSEMEDMPATIPDEDLEESGLETHDNDEDERARMGMTGSDTYSTLLIEHEEQFKRFLKSHEDMQSNARAFQFGAGVSNGFVESMVEELRAIFDELSAAGRRKVEWDPEFDETARRLIESTLAEMRAPQA